MTNHMDLATLQQQARTQQEIETAITRIFAAEDDGLREALTTARKAGLPEIHISPIQGKLLQLLAVACNAHKILEIGSLAGYSSIWLARGLRPGGRMITLEIDPKHAEIARNSFARAGIADRAEVRLGKALDLLPQLAEEGPFDLVFIDADKALYPQYLEWALQLSRPGSMIVADNGIWSGLALRDIADNNDADVAGIIEYNKRVASNPRLVSVALAMRENYTDGFTVAVVQPETKSN